MQSGQTFRIVVDTANQLSGWIVTNSARETFSVLRMASLAVDLSQDYSSLFASFIERSIEKLFDTNDGQSASPFPQRRESYFSFPSFEEDISSVGALY
jgi:hypothetical protein